MYCAKTAADIPASQAVERLRQRLVQASTSTITRTRIRADNRFALKTSVKTIQATCPPGLGTAVQRPGEDIGTARAGDPGHKLDPTPPGLFGAALSFPGDSLEFMEPWRPRNHPTRWRACSHPPHTNRRSCTARLVWRY